MGDLRLNEPALQFNSTTTLSHRRWIAQWVVVFLLACAAASAYLTRHCLAVANTSIQSQIGCNNEQFGYLYGAFSLGYLIFQVPGGWIGQKLGTRLALPIFAILWSIMTLFTALATTLPLLIAVRFLFGLAQAGLVPNQARILLDWIPDSSRGTASSVLMVGMSVGAVASLSLTSTLMAYFDWRSIFLAYSGIGVLWAIIFFVLFRATPAEVRWLRSPSTADPKCTSTITQAEVENDKLRLGTLLLHGSIWGLAGMALFKAAGYNLLVTFLPALLQYAYAVPQDQTGSLTAWSMVAMVVGSMLGGAVVDAAQLRTSNKFYSRSGVGGITLGLAAAFTLAAGFASTATGVAALLAMASLFSGMAGASPWVATMDIGGTSTGVVMGLMNSTSALAGIAISPLVGRFVDEIKETNGNWSLVIYLHAAFYLVAALCWLPVNPEKTINSVGDDRAV